MISPARRSSRSLSVTNALGRSPQFSCGIATTGALQDGRMAHERLLDLDGRDVLAARDDDVLGAVAQLDVAVRVPHAEVARVEPASRGRPSRWPRGPRSSRPSRCCRASPPRPSSRRRGGRRSCLVDHPDRVGADVGTPWRAISGPLSSSSRPPIRPGLADRVRARRSRSARTRGRCRRRAPSSAAMIVGLGGAPPVITTSRPNGPPPGRWPARSARWGRR
jgi:hypothetical protein